MAEVGSLLARVVGIITPTHSLRENMRILCKIRDETRRDETSERLKSDDEHYILNLNDIDHQSWCARGDGTLLPYIAP